MASIDTVSVPSDPMPRVRRRTVVARLVEATPLIAIVLIAGIMGTLVWLADRNEREEARQALIRDALWVEQALRFQISVGRDGVAQLAQEIGNASLDASGVAARIRTLMAAHPEIVQAAWFDAEGRILQAQPPLHPDDDLRPVPQNRPARGGQGGDGVVRRIAGRGFVTDMTVPVEAFGRPIGSLGVVVQLDRLLGHHVPWWITQNSLVALTDPDGTVLAAKSSIEPAATAARHTISFDPPFPGVMLSITANDRASNLTTNSLLAAILGLAAVSALSIFALQRHYRRRLEAETSLGEALALRKAMEDSLTVGMRARDLDGRVIYVNPAFCRMVDFDAADLIGRAPPMPYWLPDLVEETLARHQSLSNGRALPVSFETRFRRRDGTIFDVLVYEAPLIDADGRHRGWMGSIIDVTDQKRAAALERLQAETLARTGRLITMGEMASTISHELNQPLAAIASYAAGCLNVIRSGRWNEAEIAEALEKLDLQARRAGQIIRRVHDFVRKREPQFARLDVAALVRDLAGFVTPDARKSGIQIEVDAAEDLPPVRADRILIEQVVLNLVRNGIEAMAAGGRGGGVLTLRAGRERAPDGTAEVVIAIEDRGPGIEPAVAERLFSPFLTTKPEGMGMGLNICRSIVELHQGRLSHAPRPGGGTIFAVSIPAERQEAAA